MNTVRVSRILTVGQYADIVASELLEEMLNDCSFKDLFHLHYDIRERNDFKSDMIRVIEKKLKEIN